MLGLVLLAAETTPSRVPFFIIGGVLVVWALALAAIGLTRPGFPYDSRGTRAVMGISLALSVLAIGSAIVTS